MSLWLHGLIFVVSLPLSVLLWASLLALFDNDEKIHELIRFAAVLTASLAFVALFGREAVITASLALALVIVCHVVGFWWVRKRFVGLDRPD